MVCTRDVLPAFFWKWNAVQENLNFKARIIYFSECINFKEGEL